MVILSCRLFKIRPIDDAVIPFPNEEVTPPVTKINFPSLPFILIDLPYIVSGAEMPNKSRAFLSTCRVARHKLSRKAVNSKLSSSKIRLLL